VLDPPLPSDNPFSSEQECIGPIGSHAHHSSFAACVPDQLLCDGALGHSPSAILNFLPPSNITHQPLRCTSSRRTVSSPLTGWPVSIPARQVSALDYILPILDAFRLALLKLCFHDRRNKHVVMSFICSAAVHAPDAWYC
jgi:hypothetical protein